jgi:hypothetical protein
VLFVRDQRRSITGVLKGKEEGVRRRERRVAKFCFAGVSVAVFSVAETRQQKIL